MHQAALVAHVFFGTLAFGFAITFELLMKSIGRSGDVRTIRTAFTLAVRYAIWIGPLFGIAVLLGFGVAIDRHEPLLQTWLVISYVLAAIGLFLGTGLNRPAFMGILEAAKVSPDDAPSPELKAAVARFNPATWLMVLLMIALITLMFVKPFSN